MDPSEIETPWQSLAAAVDVAGPEREALFLAKLALLLAREVDDPARVRALIALALRDLE